jgi:glycosyltransferase involved in cell wall biosynthesis
MLLVRSKTGRTHKDLIFAHSREASGFYPTLRSESPDPPGAKARRAFSYGRMTDRAHPRVPSSPALPISATVICKNEEACIGKCLASLEGLAEVVVVDSGSTDRTLEIAEERIQGGQPIRLIRQPWLGYARQKQFALDQATQNWVLSIDADEWLDDALRAELPRLIAVETSVVGWRLRRTLTLYGSPSPVSLWTRPENIVRLVRRGHAHFDAELLVHEGLIVDGPTPVAAYGLLRHERGLPLNEQMKKEIVYAKLKAEQRLERGVKPSRWKLLLSPPIYFARIFLWNRFFLCGWAGFIHAMTGATYSLMTESMHRQFYYARRTGKERTP